MADRQDGEVVRLIVGAERLEGEAARRAIALHLQEAAEQRARAATRAAAAPAAEDGRPEVGGRDYAHATNMDVRPTFVGVTLCPEGGLDARPDAAGDRGRRGYVRPWARRDARPFR